MNHPILKNALVFLVVLLIGLSCSNIEEKKMHDKKYPMAITMWDFSWLERRWPGAGYEDWDKALDELKERGYNCVRIDAYPHLIAVDPEKEWMLDPHWNNQDWGSPAINIVQVQPNLNEFIAKCRDREIRVALSTWWREDTARTAENIKSPRDLANVWLATLKSVEAGGVLDNIEYVDLSNEFPHPAWTPFLPKDFDLKSEQGKEWLTEPVRLLKEHYPDLKYTYSFAGVHDAVDNDHWSELNFLEPHVWMVQYTDFYKIVGYNYAPFGGEDYKKMALYGAKTYYENPEKYLNGVRAGVKRAAAWSRQTGLPLGTTECWGIVDYKDFPLLEWDYVKETCALGTTEAAATGRWLYIATSNFCGPQFKGMWRDVEWHQNLTDIIKSAPVDSSILF